LRPDRAAVVHHLAPPFGRRGPGVLVDAHVRLSGHGHRPRRHHVAVILVVQEVVDRAVRVVIQPATGRRPAARGRRLLLVPVPRRRQSREPVQPDGAGQRERAGHVVRAPAAAGRRLRLNVARAPPAALERGARLRHVVRVAPLLFRLHGERAPPRVLVTARRRLHVVSAPPVGRRGGGGLGARSRRRLSVASAAPGNPRRRPTGPVGHGQSGTGVQVHRPVLSHGLFRLTRTGHRYPGRSRLMLLLLLLLLLRRGLREARVSKRQPQRRQTGVVPVPPIRLVSVVVVVVVVRRPTVLLRRISAALVVPPAAVAVIASGTATRPTIAQ